MNKRIRDKRIEAKGMNGSTSRLDGMYMRTLRRLYQQEYGNLNFVYSRVREFSTEYDVDASDVLQAITSE